MGQSEEAGEMDMRSLRKPAIYSRPSSVYCKPVGIFYLVSLDPDQLANNTIDSELNALFRAYQDERIIFPLPKVNLPFDYLIPREIGYIVRNRGLNLPRWGH